MTDGIAGAVEFNARRLTDQELVELGPPEAVRIPLDLVDPNPNNPRHQLPEVDVLAQNIRQFGLLQPITVRRAGERYELIGGHRRLAAFRRLRDLEPHQVAWRSVPAVVRTADDDEAYLMLISSQVHNRSWRPREEAAALERLAQAGLTLRQIGERLQRTEGWASKRLRVYADSVLSGYVQSGRLKPAVADELVRVLDPETRKRLAEEAATANLTQDQVQGRVRALRLDRQLSQIGKLARQLAELLSSVDAGSIPMSATRDLMVVHGQIEVKSGMQKQQFPSIEQAQRAAGVRSQEKPPRRRTRFRDAN